MTNEISIHKHLQESTVLLKYTGNRSVVTPERDKVIGLLDTGFGGLEMLPYPPHYQRALYLIAFFCV